MIKRIFGVYVALLAVSLAVISDSYASAVSQLPLIFTNPERGADASRS